MNTIATALFNEEAFKNYLNQNRYKRYELGLNDCYTFVRDWLRALTKKNIDIPYQYQCIRTAIRVSNHINYEQLFDNHNIQYYSFDAGSEDLIDGDIVIKRALGIHCAHIYFDNTLWSVNMLVGSCYLARLEVNGEALYKAKVYRLLKGENK